MATSRPTTARRPEARRPIPSRKKTREEKLKLESVVRSNRHTPSVYRRGRVYFLILNQKGQYRIPYQVILSALISFACALVIILTSAQISGMERLIAQRLSDYRALHQEYISLDSRTGGRYTVEEIEYLAFTRLGMTHPDPSQIIEIYVPRQPQVLRFNRDENLLPTENYFWQDIRTFASDILDRVFGR